MSSVLRYPLLQGAKTLRRISMQPMEDPRAEKAALLAVGYLGNLMGSPPVTHLDVEMILMKQLTVRNLESG